MKTLHLAIITGSGIVITIIFGIVFFFPSLISGMGESSEAVNLDLSNSTTENPLGIKAQVVMEVDRSISCPVKCTIPPTLHLVLTSEKGAQFLGYQVCDGDSCKKDNLENSLYVHLAQVSENYSGAVGFEASHINLGNLPWQVGDTVHVLVKAFPVTLQPNNVVIREQEKTMVVNLGELKITSANFNQKQNLENNTVTIASIRKLVDSNQLKEILSGKPMDNYTGIVFGSFDWSRDGKFIAFSTNPYNPPSYLWMMDPDGKQIRLLDIPKFNSLSSIHISPYDDAVYFIGSFDDNKVEYQDIFRYDLNNGTCSDLTGHLHIREFDFTPDGNLLFVENHRNSTFMGDFTYLIKRYDLLWLANLDGQKLRVLYNGTEYFSRMSLSPDGNNLVFFDNDNPLHPADNGTVIEHDFPGGFPAHSPPEYLATFRLDQKNFRILDNSTDYVYGNFKWTHDGNYIVSDRLFTNKYVEERTPNTYYYDAGFVTLIPISNPLNQTVLYGSQIAPYSPLPEGLTLSPDQKSVIFGMDADYYDENILGKGIYRIDFENSLP